jgi:ribonucleotide monophosphatase NagD (HAD superfamily)
MNVARLQMKDGKTSTGAGVDRTVKAVFTDVDGTLFNSKHALSEDTKEALLATMQAGIPVIMATGKVQSSHESQQHS